jgi:16S rRNA (guanine966-N2)-methyltransferase
VRITGGSSRGRNLPGRIQDGIRPTSSRVREALFDILGQDLAGESLLDATGGSGLVAFEAASRGAMPLLVLERSRAAVTAIREAARGLGFAERVDVLLADALLWKPPSAGFDLVFADPPYAAGLEDWVRRLLPCAHRHLVLEHAWRISPPGPSVGLPEPRTRRYGDTALSFYDPASPVAPAEPPVAPPEPVTKLRGDGRTPVARKRR